MLLLARRTERNSGAKPCLRAQCQTGWQEGRRIREDSVTKLNRRTNYRCNRYIVAVTSHGRQHGSMGFNSEGKLVALCTPPSPSSEQCGTSPPPPTSSTRASTTSLVTSPGVSPSLCATPTLASTRSLPSLPPPPRHLQPPLLAHQHLRAVRHCFLRRRQQRSQRRHWPAGRGACRPVLIVVGYPGVSTGCLLVTGMMVRTGSGILGWKPAAGASPEANLPESKNYGHF